MSLCDKFYAEYNKNADGLAHQLIISKNTYNEILNFLVSGGNYHTIKEENKPKFKAWKERFFFIKFITQKILFSYHVIINQKIIKIFTFDF